MTDYKQGKIYAIRSPSTDKYYIGSTANTLCKRFYHHKNKSNLCSSSEIIAFGDAYIELIELFPCNSKMELNKREGEVQREMKANIVNRNYAHLMPGQKFKINAQQNKIINVDNIQMALATEAQKKASKSWYEKNKEAHAVARKAKYAADKDTRERLRNNSKRSYYKKKLSELDSSDDSDAAAPLEEIQIEMPTLTDVLRLNTINFII
jgi:hypothetical protein